LMCISVKIKSDLDIWKRFVLPSKPRVSTCTQGQVATAGGLLSREQLGTAQLPPCSWPSVAYSDLQAPEAWQHMQTKLDIITCMHFPLRQFVPL